jgi:cytochrome P450
MSLPLPPSGPKGHWLLGSLSDWKADILGFYARCAREYGDIVSVRIAHRRAAFVSHPNGVEEVLATRHRDFVKNFAQRMLAPWLGKGLILSEGDFWLRQRRLMQPAFRRERVASYGDTMVALTRRMLDSWRDGETCDIHEEMMRLTLAVASRTLFDADVTDRASEISQALLSMMDDFNARFRGLFAAPLWLPTPANRRTRRGIRHLHEVIDRIIAERRRSGADRGDLLSILLQARDEEGDGGRMTDQQVRDEVMTLLLAGHDTTANALTWTWYLLANHPAAADRLAAEAGEVLGDRPATAADLPRLSYAERVIQESMRLYPPVYGFGREAVQDTEVMGYRIPKGWNVIMCQWVMHRDARFFPDPERFDPDRWADGLAQRLPRYAYFPFGGGPRQCIGTAFAQLEAVLILATVAREYHFTIDPAHPVELNPAVTLRPRHGLRAPLRRRVTVSSPDGTGGATRTPDGVFP